MMDDGKVPNARDIPDGYLHVGSSLKVGCMYLLIYLHVYM